MCECNNEFSTFVLADINPVYLNALLPKRFVALPLDEKRYVAFRDIVTTIALKLSHWSGAA
jgi:hypothetical protein